MKFSNLEKIREAWRIGWAAVLQYKEEALKGIINTVVFLDDKHEEKRFDGIEACNDAACAFYHRYEVNNEFEIIGYKYVAELAGNEEPREGQRFRKRDSSLQWVYDFGDLRSSQNHSLRLSFKKIDKTKWHPYFD